MQVIYDSQLTVIGAPPNVKDYIKEQNTYHNPKFYKLENLGVSTYNTPKKIYTYESLEDDQVLRIHRGYASDLTTFLNLMMSNATMKRSDLKVIDRSVQAPPLEEEAGHLDYKEPLTLRDYQSRCVRSTTICRQGIIEAPTGAGKTIIGLEIIRQHKQRSLILVHTKELARQWREVIEKWFGFTPGFIGSGKIEVHSYITICMLQTLSRNIGMVDVLSKEHGLVIVDEAHHVPADTFATVMASMHCYNRYGLTATPFRTDGLHILIERVLGKRIALVNPDEVENVGGTVPLQIHPIKTHYHDNSSQSWNEFLSFIAIDRERCQKILDIVCFHRPTLILTDRVAHAELIHELSKLRWDDAVLAHGGLRKKERDKAFQDIKSAQLTIGTTGLLGEGLDISRWECVILATPISSKVKLLQAIGRVARPCEGKEKGIVYDLVDGGGFAGSSFNKRKKIYEDRGIGIQWRAYSGFKN